MAKNKLSYHWESISTPISDRVMSRLIIEGTQRQPTLVEALNFLSKEKIEEDTFIVVAQHDGCYIPEDECRHLAFIPVDTEHCPVCGHEHDTYPDFCPVCKRKWSD